MSNKLLTSADIQDGKTEFDPVTGVKTLYKKIKGGYEVQTTTPQPNGTIKTKTQTFYDPTPVSADDLANKTFLTSDDIEDGKIEIDSVTKVKTTYKKIKGGYEVKTSTPQPDGTIKTKTQTFYDPIPSNQEFDIDNTSNRQKTTTTKKTDQSKRSDQQVDRAIQSRKLDQQQQHHEYDIDNMSNRQKTTTTTTKTDQSKRSDQQVEHAIQSRKLDQQQHHEYDIQTQQTKKTQEKKYKSDKTVEEVHVSQKTEFSGKRVISRKGTIEETVEEEQNVRAITEKKDKKKKNAPLAIQDKPGEKTTVKTKKIRGGTEYHYTTVKENGETVTQIKTVYDEEEIEMTDAEIKQYHKHLKEAEKHKDLTAPKTVKTRQGTTKKVIPSEDSGEITTVETVQIDGGVEYHYTTVTAEGVVKKTMKTVYDAVRVEEDEEEIIEEYEEEIIEPGEPIVETIQTTKIVSKSEKKEIEMISSNGAVIKRKEKKTKK